LSIYEVFNNDDSKLRNLKKQQSSNFAESLKAYQNSDFDKAIEMLKLICLENPQDQTAANLLERCREYKDKGWTGIDRPGK